ncbi:MAG: hypothetical protein A2277_06545 [Desulfobacterales bacterium RIFOXYA12_FULL_46_15]|nr:MAG: hypothetical protein A2277_06545 [Desulfobacterales bacterium RIFOXYA12_FULL_46_15]
MPVKHYGQENSVLNNWPDESTSEFIADKDIICHGSALNWLSTLLYQFHQLLNRICDSINFWKSGQINSEREKKSLALQVIRSQKYEAMGIIMGGVTHNFNNILMCIIANAQKGESLSGNPEIKDRFGKICQVARKAAEISKQLVDLSKPDPQVQYDYFSLNDIIKETVLLVRSSFPVSIQIEEDLGSGIGIIIGNSCQIQQVLMNLLVNAYQAIPSSNGNIRIKTSKSILKEQSAENGGLLPGRYLELTVKDNGSGMDETTLKNLFVPFFSTKKESGGCGLGLSTAMYIIKHHNGHIHAASKPGEGSTFKILFPAIN